jgi:pyruvate kinase
MTTHRKTRIVATIGPSVDTAESIAGLLKAGINIARLNFSHGTHKEHRERIGMIRQASRDTGVPVAIMLDTKGPEIRTGIVPDDGKITLVNGDRIILTTENVPGSAGRISISYPLLPREVSPGGHIFIADGLIDLKIESVSGNEIFCVVVNGGVLGSRKNVNVPGVKTSLPAMTEQDREDILFGLSEDIDFIAASFIRKPQDVIDIQNLVLEYGASTHVIAKIEDQEGLDNIDEIIRVSNGIMIARGDLGVQLELEAIPLAQKRIIEKCNRENKPVITATQMLDSMIHNPNPTRAELTDVANAIFDGSDAVMLSGETASGKYPVRSVETLNRIACAVEGSPEYHERCKEYFTFHKASNDIGQTVAKAAYLVATDIDAAAIVTPSLRGNSPRLLSKYRPSQVIIAVTTSEKVVRELLIHWGVYPILSEQVKDSEVMIQNALRLALKHRLIKKRDKVVTAAGIPLHSPLMMNTIKVHFMGNILNRGHESFGGHCSGKIVKARSCEEAIGKLEKNGTEILLVRHVDPDCTEILKNISGIIVEDEFQIPPETAQKVNPEIVCIAHVPKAYDQFENGLIVSLDGNEKIIYEGYLEEDL